MTGALVSTGIITRCCGIHHASPTGSCCDPDDCGPCCPECPTCPRVQAMSPEQRPATAREHRQWLADFLARLRRTYVLPAGAAAIDAAAVRAQSAIHHHFSAEEN